MAFMTSEWSGTEYFKVKDFDHIEFYVGNAKQVVHFYRSAFGFQPHAYCGPETGVRDRVSYVLKQNNLFQAISNAHLLASLLEHKLRLCKQAYDLQLLDVQV